MFARLFEKYARAVSDGRERDWLFSKFKLKTVVSIIFYALCVVVIVLALTLEPVIEEPWAFMLLTAVVFAWIVMGITSLVLWISFRRSYKNILNRPASDGEMPEITAYRQKTAEANRSNFKKLWWAWLIFGMCAVAFIVLIALDVISNPDSESMGVYGTAAFWVLLAGALVLVLSYILKSTINRQNGQTLEQSTADEVKAIDEAQGRETKYSLQNDPNLSSYKHLFPEPALYEKAEGVRKRYAKFATFGIAAVMTLIILAATAMSLPACMNSYEHAGEIGGLEIYISKRYNRGFAGAYFWDGSAENMAIDVPDEYDGCPITALGGGYGTGVPVTFGVIYPDRQYAEGENVYSVSPAAAEASIERLKNEGGLEIEYLDFTVNLGANVEDFDMIDSPLTVIEREGDNMNSAYVVRYYFNCDGDNETFYSDGGKLYFRSSGDLVDEFCYTDFTF